jgi:acetolactate synthase-1/2/3 large subunit
MAQVTVAKLIAEALLINDVKRIYGIIGTSILDFIDALYDYQDRINFITTRHEQVAVSAADGEARVTANFGVAAVHAGPGFMNSLISLAIAMKDRIPVLLITGGVRRRLRGTDAWLEVDQESIAKAIVKKYLRISKSSEAIEILGEAFRNLSTYPRGPVVIEVPEDVWNEKLELKSEDLEFLKIKEAISERPPQNIVKEIANSLINSKRPLILACGELVYNKHFESQYLISLAEKTGSYIVTSGNARGACSEAHERSLGRCGFGGGNMVADNAIENCDFLLVLGNEFDDITTYAYTLLPKGEVFVISKDDSANKRPRYYEFLNYEPLSFLKELNEQISGKYTHNKNEWDSKILEWKNQWIRMIEEALNKKYSNAVNPSKFFYFLDKLAPKNRIITGGQGVHILYAYDFIKIYKPRTFLASTNLGAMGYAFPAAIGAKISNMNDEVIAILGDGEFMMTVQDLETLKREKIPLKIIIVNDNSYRVLYLRQVVQKQGRIYETLLSNPDFVTLANSFGIEGIRVDNDDKIDEAINKLLNSKESYLVELVIDPNDMPPLNLKQTLAMSR